MDKPSNHVSRATELKVDDRIKDNDIRLGERSGVVKSFDTVFAHILWNTGRSTKVNRAKIHPRGKVRTTGYSLV